MTQREPVADEQTGARYDLRSEPLADVISKSWDFGQNIDLSGIGYGRVDWGNRTDVRDIPSPYYYFLAGLVQRYGFSRIFEIGTHWGGATRAMWHAIREGLNPKVATVDITTESDNRLNAYPDICKIVGDGNSAEVFFKVMEIFGNDPIDLVYIDAAHQTMPTFTSYAIYSLALRPKIVVFDDITLNGGMQLAWSLIQTGLPATDTMNAFDIVPAIRPSPDRPGFGVARLKENITASES